MSDPTPAPVPPAPPLPPKPPFTPPWWLNLVITAAAAVVAAIIGWFAHQPNPSPPPAPVPPISVPAKVSVTPGQLFHIRATLAGSGLGKTVRWYASSDAVQFIPSDDLKDACTLVGIAPQTPGDYCIHAHAAQNGEPLARVCCVLTVGGTPPGPPPTPPRDPFLAVLQAAYAQETDTQRVAQVQQLAALYDAQAKLVISDNTVNTILDVQTKFEAAVKATLPDTALPKVRAAIGANLNSTLPRPASTPLTAALRQTLSVNFARIASDLETLK